MSYEFLGSRSSVSHYWNKKVVLMPGAVDSENMELPSAGELVSAFNGRFGCGGWSKPLDVSINASKLNSDGVPHQLLSIDINAARDRYLNGYSICFGNLAPAIDSVGQLKRVATDVFGLQELIYVTAYLSPPGVTGLLHYDRQHNFFIQREGTKRWFVSKLPAVKNPHDNLIYAGADSAFFDAMKDSDYRILLPKDCGRQEYDLGPGDVLYLPPGYYHSPETLSEHSLHYTLTVEPASFWSDLNQRLFSLMLAHNVDFLQDHRFLSKAEKKQLYRQCADEIIREMASDQWGDC